MSLRKQGASKGATASFLISTPETGVDSIIATYSVLGLPFAVIRPVAAFCNAIMGGWLINKFGDKDEVVPVDASAKTCCCHHKQEETHHEGFLGMMREALRFGFVEMIEDIG